MNKRRPNYKLYGRYVKMEQPHQLVRATGNEDPESIIDGVIVNMSPNNSCTIWLTFTHYKPEYNDIAFTTNGYGYYEIVNPFKHRNREEMKEQLRQLVKDCLRSGFWHDGKNPLINADTKLIRSIFFQLIEENPFCN